MSTAATAAMGSQQLPMENVCKSLALDMKKYDEKVGLCVESTRTWMTDIIAKNKRKVQEALGLEIVDCKHMRIENDPKSSVFNAISSTHVTEEKGTGAPVTHDESSESKKSVEHHPDDDIETGNMIVVELKHELRSRGLAVTGRKAELQERLSAHLDATREKRRLAAVRDNKIEACSSQSKGCDPSDSSSMSDNEARRMSVDIVEAVDNEKSTSAPFVPVNETTLKEDATSMSIDVTNDEAPEYDLQSTKSEATHFFDSMENNEGQITPIEEAVAMDVVKADDEQRVEAELANAQINNDNREELKQERAINKSPPNKMMNVIMKPISNMFSPRPTKKASNLIKGFKSNQQIFNGKEDLTSLHSTTKTKTSGSVSNKSFGSSRSSVASVISASSASSCASTSYQSAANSSEFKKSSAKKDFMGSSTTTKSDWQTSIDDKAKSSAIKLSQAKSALSVKLTTESAYERAAKQKARLEAMRGKARNEVLSASAVKEISATSKSVAKQAKEMLVTSSKKPGVSGNSRLPSATKTAALASLASTSEKTEKHRRLIAQMRERAQEKFQGPKKHTHAKVKDQLQESGGNSNKMIEESQRDQPQEINTQSKMKTKFRSPVRSLKKKSQSARSPMDTYEMSDREGSDSESDSDSDSEDEAKPKKRIPNWARSVNLVAALEKQYSTGPDCIDPDTIFPEVESCNLEEIFDQRKTRFVRRTSSGNWTNDKVTTMEKLTYKRNMGFKGT